MTQHKDPNKPGWTPPPVTTSSGQYGHGSDFGADIFALYRAGRLKFPEMARAFSTMTSTAHDLQQEIDYLYNSAGFPVALNDVQTVRQTLQVALIHTTRALTESGTALVDIAAMFLTTDNDAAGTFQQEMKTTTEDFSHHTEPVPAPPGLGAPYKHTYTPPPLDTAPRPDLVHQLTHPWEQLDPEPKYGWDV